LSGNLEGCDAWGRSFVGPRHTPGIEKKDAALLFVARHMRVAVEEDVDILRRSRGRNVNEAAADAVSFQVDGEGPFKVGVAIAAHESYGRSDAFQPDEQTRLTDISEMPDLIDIICQCFEIFGEMIVRVGEDEDAQRFAIHEGLLSIGRGITIL